MPDFKTHLSQAEKNLIILQGVNNHIPDSWDWQVTIGFYAALHLANAHIAKTINAHYRSHSDMRNALNFEITINPSKFDEDAYIAYVRLQNLSRRARYLCSEDNQNQDYQKPYYISDKFFGKSLRLLSTVISYFEGKYGIKINPIQIKCDRLQHNELPYFIKMGSTTK